MYGKSAEKITLEKGLDNFVRFKKMVDLVRPKTAHNYEEKFKDFMDYFGGKRLCSEIKSSDIMGFVEYKKKMNADIRDTSISSYLSVIRVVLYHFMKEGYTVPFKITVKKSRNKLTKTYNEDEIAVLLERPAKSKGWNEYRNWVAICIFMGTGMRLRSAAGLKNEDIDLRNGYIHITEIKNGLPMTVSIPDELVLILQEYMGIRGGEAGDYLLCSRMGEGLSPVAIQTAIKRYNKRRGIKRTSIHSFRHTFAIQFLQNEGDTTTLKSTLGHQSYDMINEYARLSGVQIKALADKHNPLGKYRTVMKTNKRIKF